MPHVEYEDAATGRCRFCGFLSKHATGVTTARFYEMEHSERTQPESMQTHTVEYGARAETEPMCFLGKINLTEVLRNEGDGKLIAAIMADRKCDGWYPYMPGLSPKEHYEERTMQRMENDRRAFEMRLFEIIQKTHEDNLKIATSNQAIVKDLKSIAEKNERFSRRVTSWVITLAALQALGTILALPGVSWVQRLWSYLFR